MKSAWALGLSWTGLSKSQNYSKETGSVFSSYSTAVDQIISSDIGKLTSAKEKNKLGHKTVISTLKKYLHSKKIAGQKSTAS